MTEITIGGIKVGAGHPAFIVAEIGINSGVQAYKIRIDKWE